jgi:CRISPR-associated protein Cas2
VRQRFAVTYDISDDARLRKVFKVMKGYGRHVQYSVFICDLNEMGLAELKSMLSEVVHHAEDQVLFFDMGPTDGRGTAAVQSLGRPYHEMVRQPMVV